MSIQSHLFSLLLPNQNREIQQASENILHVFVVDICKVINKILRKKMVSFGMTPSVVTFLVKALPTKSVSAKILV